MPPTLPTTSRFATMTAAQVTEELARLQLQYAAEDAERRERNAAILAAL